MAWSRLAWMAVAFGALSACGPETANLETRLENPVTRSLYWFRYVGGTDVRKRCAAGGPDHIRLVYNAVWGEQVRTYDLTPAPGGGMSMTARVMVDQGNLASVDVRDLNGLLDPWRMRRSDIALSAAQASSLRDVIGRSGGYGPPPAGRELRSNEFWWTVASCVGGRWGFAAYDHASDRFARVAFAQPLFALERGAVPVAQPRDMPPGQFRRDRERDLNGVSYWQLAIGRDGLRDY